MLAQVDYNDGVDIWAVGVLAYQLCYRQFDYFHFVFIHSLNIDIRSLELRSRTF